MRKPVVDYLSFRPRRINEPQFSHLKLLLYWPVFGLLFMFVERFYQVAFYYPVHCGLDDIIPFNELFLIPYLFWFVFLVGMILYTLLYEPDSFRRMMYFIMVSYTVTIVIYFIFPTCQNLRPVQFERDNILTRFISGFYEFDTNTNVCPSIHVLGSYAVMFAAWDTKRFRSLGWKLGFAAMATLISVSTVFMKQHSLLDVLAALPLCLVAYLVAYKSKLALGKAQEKAYI